MKKISTFVKGHKKAIKRTVITAAILGAASILYQVCKGEDGGTIAESIDLTDMVETAVEALPEIEG